MLSPHSQIVNPKSLIENSTDPLTAVFVPVAVPVAADTCFAHLGSVSFAAAAPAPTHRCQMIDAGGLVANGADDAVGQCFATGLPVAQSIFIADLAIFYSHKNCGL